MYAEVSQKFTNKLVVSMLPSTEEGSSSDLTIESEAALPKCKYEVLNDQRKPLLFATIGQPIVHSWVCSSTDEESDKDGDTVKIANSPTRKEIKTRSNTKTFLSNFDLFSVLIFKTSLLKTLTQFSKRNKSFRSICKVLQLLSQIIARQ